MIQIKVQSYKVTFDEETYKPGEVLPAELVAELQTVTPKEAIDFFKFHKGNRISMKVWDDDPKVNNPSTNRTIADAIIRAGDR